MHSEVCCISVFTRASNTLLGRFYCDLWHDTSTGDDYVCLRVSGDFDYHQSYQLACKSFNKILTGFISSKFDVREAELFCGVAKLKSKIDSNLCMELP